MINRVRGCIAILDREGLEGVSCECYLLVKKEFDRPLGGNGRTGDECSVLSERSEYINVSRIIAPG